MSSTMLKTLAIILIIAAIILGFVAYAVSRGPGEAQNAGQQAQLQPGANQVLAVVAVKRIPAYQAITEQEVALVPISVEPPQYYTDPGAVIGRTPLRPIPMGAPVTERSFGSTNSLAAAIPPGTQAMSLEVSDVIGVGGFVKPGDLVDVLLFLRKSGSEVENTQARVLLKSARVLSYEDRLINSAAEGNDNNGQRTRHQRTAVLAVPIEDTTRVMLGASLGELRLALRRSDNARQDNTMGQPGTSQPEYPAALATVASEGAGQPAGVAENKTPAGADGKDKQDNKVITLSELAAIKKQQKKTNKPAYHPPPRARIQVYRGTSHSRISRPN